MFLQVNEHEELSKPAEVDLFGLFAQLRLREVSELSLSANQLQSDVKRLKWQAGKSLSGDSALPNLVPTEQNALLCSKSACLQEDLTVVLNPMDIRTFLIGLA